jgi:hypothetical protein
MNKNFGNCPGPTAGPKGVVKQHNAMASGYELPATKRCVKTNQRSGATGSTKAPGLTNSR